MHINIHRGKTIYTFAESSSVTANYLSLYKVIDHPVYGDWYANEFKSVKEADRIGFPIPSDVLKEAKQIFADNIVVGNNPSIFDPLCYSTVDDVYKHKVDLILAAAKQFIPTYDFDKLWATNHFSQRAPKELAIGGTVLFPTKKGEAYVTINLKLVIKNGRPVAKLEVVLEGKGKSSPFNSLNEAIGIVDSYLIDL